jgi:hypothetical protein
MIDGFDTAWAAIADVPPVPHDLKWLIRDRWVRFYSLPDGKRYATTDAEREEVRRRADLVTSTIVGDEARLMLVSGSYAPPMSTPMPTDEQRLLHADATHWFAQPANDDDGWVVHLWASWVQYRRRSLDLIMDSVASEALTEVLFVDPRRRVAVHPYDGGVDVFLPTGAHRDSLRDTFSEWASPLPSGL